MILFRIKCDKCGFFFESQDTSLLRMTQLALKNGWIIEHGFAQATGDICERCLRKAGVYL
jgi:hypothetical protein